MQGGHILILRTIFVPAHPSVLYSKQCCNIRIRRRLRGDILELKWACMFACVCMCFPAIKAG